MKKPQSLSRFVVTAALISAGYAVLTYISAVMGLAYGGVQLRLSEALYGLAVFTPAAVPGVVIGCVLGNLASPFGLIDVVVGAFASGISAALIRVLSKTLKKALPIMLVLVPAVLNAALVGLEITLFLPNFGGLVGFLLSALQVALGEIAVCSVLGVPMYFMIKKNTSRFF